MGLFGNKKRTAQQKANMAKSRIMLRAVAIGFIVFYVIVPILNPADEDAYALDPVVRYITGAAFIVAAIVITVLTVLEYIRGKKTGRYDAKGYEDDEDDEEHSETENADSNGEDDLDEGVDSDDEDEDYDPDNDDYDSDEDYDPDEGDDYDSDEDDDPDEDYDPDEGDDYDSDEDDDPDEGDDSDG